MDSKGKEEKEKQDDEQEGQQDKEYGVKEKGYTNNGEIDDVGEQDADVGDRAEESDA